MRSEFSCISMRLAPSHQLCDGRLCWRFNERLHAGQRIDDQEFAVDCGWVLHHLLHRSTERLRSTEPHKVPIGFSTENVVTLIHKRPPPRLPFTAVTVAVMA